MLNAHRDRQIRIELATAHGRLDVAGRGARQRQVDAAAGGRRVDSAVGAHEAAMNAAAARIRADFSVDVHQAYVAAGRACIDVTADRVREDSAARGPRLDGAGDVLRGDATA